MAALLTRRSEIGYFAISLMLHPVAHRNIFSETVEVQIELIPT